MVWVVGARLLLLMLHVATLLLKACRPSRTSAFGVATFAGVEGRLLAEVLAGEAAGRQATHGGDRK